MATATVTASATASFTIGALILTIIIATYLLRNIFFHPLSQHPGPKLWAATRLPWCWHQFRGTLSWRIAELHDTYGPAVRVAPDEVSYATAGAWKTIYGHRSVEMAKDPNFSLTPPSGAQNILTSDRETHSRHRRVLAHAFSEKALREQEFILQMYCSKLCRALEDRCGSGPLDLVKWFTFATFDLIGDLSFGQPFGCLDSGTVAPFIASISTGSRELMLTQLLRYYRVLPLRSALLALLGARKVSGARAANLRRAVQTVRDRIARGSTADRRDVWHYVLSHLPAETAAGGGIQEDGKLAAMTEAEMYANAFSISIAGSESTATALSASVFLLLRHPAAYRRAVAEVRSAFAVESDISSATAAARLPFLCAVLTETLRVHPPVAITLPRRVPPGGEVIEGRFVAGGYTVGVNHLSCYRSARNFADPSTFRPERWLGSEGGGGGSRGEHQAACFQPFSYGPRNCLGKNLAWAEMRLLLARLLWRFDLELVETSDNLCWMDKQKIWGFWNKPPLMCRLALAHQE